MDRIDRRGFLECMAWIGSGLAWTASGGVLSSRALGTAEAAAGSDFSFVQVSDSHVGFKGQANAHATASLQQVAQRINALPGRPALLIHNRHLPHRPQPVAS